MLKLVKSVVVLSLLLCVFGLRDPYCPEHIDTIGEDVVIFVNCSTVQPFVTWTYTDGLSNEASARIELSYNCSNSTQVIAQNTSEHFYPVTTDIGYGITEVPLGSECTFSGCYSELTDGDGGLPIQKFYLLQSVNCTVDNVDECLRGVHNCDDVNAECINTIGSFYCLCNHGYTGNGIECTNVDECALGQASCDDHAHCNDTVGRYNCTCDPGFEGDGFYCTNIDECESGEHNCHDDLSSCEDNNGSYTCVCPLGYEWNGLVCKDWDECTEGMYTCTEHAMCSNTMGGYTCVCVDGYHNVSEEGGSGSGGERELNCTDIDECEVTPDLCGDNSLCIDTEGSYECSCLHGYHKTDGSQSCLNIDECEHGSDDCDSNAECTDTDGSYRCTCNVGFEGDGSTCNIGPIIGVLGIGSPAALIVVAVVVVLIVLQFIMRRRRRRRKAAIYSDYRIFFQWRDELNPDYAPVEVELRRVSDTPSMISTFDLLDKSRKISIPKDLPEEDSISDTGSDQPLSSTEVPATTAPNSKETNEQRPKYIDIGFLDPSGVIENQHATLGTPTSQHCVPKEVQRKIGQSPPESSAFLLSSPPARSTGYVASNHFEQKASSDYVVEARSELTASSDYVVEARSEATADSDYVVEARSEATADSGYVVEARSEPTAGSDYVVEARSEATADSDYVVEARSEATADSDYVVEARSEATADSDYVVEARSEPTAGSDYVVEAKSEPTVGSGYVGEDSSMGVFEWTPSRLEGGGGYLSERNIDQDIMATKCTTPTLAPGDEYATAFPKPEPPNSISSDDNDGSEHLRNDECILDLSTFEEVLYDAKGSSALNIDGYVKDSRADSGTPDSLADPSLLPSPPQSDVQVVSIESATLPLGSENVPSWQSSSQGSSYLREPTSRNHLMSNSTDSGYIQENTASSSIYSPDVYSPFSDVFVPPGRIESDSGYSGYGGYSTSSFEQSADAPLEVFAHEYGSSHTQLPPTIHEGIAAESPILQDSQRQENLSSNFTKTDLSSSMYVRPANTYSLQYHHGEGHYQTNNIPGSNTTLSSCNGYIQ